MKHISVLAYEHCWAMNVMIVKDFFTIVERLQSHIGQPPEFNCQIITHDGKPIKSSNGSPISAESSLESKDSPQLIVIPPIDGSLLNEYVIGREKIIYWLREQAARNIPIITITTGAFLLAEAGLLEDKVVATHWAFVKTFRRKYPNIKFLANKSFTYSKGVYSTGTFIGCLEVLLYLLSIEKGDRFAQLCGAHSLLNTPELLSPTLLGKRNHDDESIMAVQDWIEDNYNKSFTIEELAKLFGFSLRNLKRRFKLATKTSPNNYTQLVRIDKAKKLLMATDKSVAEISYAVGYENHSYFIKLFKKNLGYTPSKWRQL